MKGVEPPRRRRQILSLVRLPIPPHPQFTLYIVGGGWWIRTTESNANRFTVCPLWPLGKSSVFGAGNRTRTYNLLITSQLLYQLSHTSLLRGYVLLSQAVAHQVPSALRSLTSVFGMGTGVSSLL